MTGDTHRLLGDAPVASLHDWMQGDGGLGYAHARELDPGEVIDEVEASGLRGRGGAGFPTGTKWRGVTSAAEETASPVYLVCNAAEGEPGTYKDRTLIEHNPYAMLEGMLIAMYATGAVAGYVGIKEKFTRPLERLRTALTELREAGWANADNIEIVPGPDEYLFGEEKAMLEVIEGKLPMPRLVPPYQMGLFATVASPNPTVVNNVESYCHVTHILTHGAAWFRETGTDASPGSMIFTVVGDVDNPGTYELPLGTRLRTLLEDVAGATDIKAVYSGTSQSVIVPAMLDTELCFDAMDEVGTGLGSGGFLVYDESRAIVDVLATLMRFLAIESCGQCNACKLGTADIWELLRDIQRGDAARTHLEQLLRHAQTVTDQNRCYLPVGAQLMVASTIQAFEDELIATVEAGEPTPADIPVPLIEDIDEDAGEVIYDPRYHLKQSDWGYSDEDPGEQRIRAARTRAAEGGR